MVTKFSWLCKVASQEAGPQELAEPKQELAQKDAAVACLEQRLTELRQQALQQAQQDQQKIEQLIQELHDKEHGALQQIKVS